jgi:transposase-like protein
MKPPERLQDLESLLTVYDHSPAILWKKLRTTNAIERCFREVRRRTRPMSCFQNTASVERILFALFYRMNRLWESKPLPQITQKS